MFIYTDDYDRHGFLELLAGCVDDYDVDCHAYCLMGNHYHLVITTAHAKLSRAMKALNGTYAQRWNVWHDRIGHVFQGRFGGQVVQDGRYLLAACRDVVLNPVRAGLVCGPGGLALEQLPGHGGTGDRAVVPQTRADLDATRRNPTRSHT